MTEFVPPAPDDNLLLLPHGRALLTVEGRGVFLRRPTLGQYRELREAFQDATTRLGRIAGEVQQQVEDGRPEWKRDGGGEPPDTAAVEAESARVRALDDAAMVEVQRLWTGWYRLAARVLGGDDLPDDDLLPPWMAEGRAAGRMLAHFRKAPGTSGDEPGQ